MVSDDRSIPHPRVHADGLGTAVQKVLTRWQRITTHKDAAATSTAAGAVRIGAAPIGCRRAIGGRAHRGEQRTQRGERVDVEQIMRDIRARISQRSGRALEPADPGAGGPAARGDPRSAGIEARLLDQLRRSAGERQTAPEPAPPPQPVFEEASLYDSPSAVLRFIRKLLNPILRLFFNPTPVAHALAVQGRLSAEAAAREPRAIAARRVERPALRDPSAARHRGRARQPRGTEPVAPRRIAGREGRLQRSPRPQLRGDAASPRAATAGRRNRPDRRAQPPLPRRRTRPPRMPATPAEGQRDRRTAVRRRAAPPSPPSPRPSRCRPRRRTSRRPRSARSGAHERDRGRATRTTDSTTSRRPRTR